MNVPKHSLINDDSLTISFLQAGSSSTLKDGWRHTKTVPFTIIARPLSGFYTVTCLQETVTIKPGETVLVPANVEVTFEHHSIRDADMSAQWVHISWQLFKSIDITSLLEFPLKVGGVASSRFGDLIGRFLKMQTDGEQSNAPVSDSEK